MQGKLEVSKLQNRLNSVRSLHKLTKSQMTFVKKPEPLVKGKMMKLVEDLKI